MGGGGSTRRVTFEADENENITVVKGVRVSAGPALGSPQRCGPGLAAAPLPMSLPRVAVPMAAPAGVPLPAGISPLRGDKERVGRSGGSVWRQELRLSLPDLHTELLPLPCTPRIHLRCV
uniref:Uncharacterized protein n=1 Tax=Junco hyemalis TaxID=40217 RepID=A0A8C5JQU9_JUNHY